VPYACKRTQLAAAGCRLGATVTCGIIRVSYTLKVGLDRDYSPAMLLSCRHPGPLTMWVYITLSRCTGSYGTQRMTVGDHRSAVEACVLCWLGYRLGCAGWAQAAI
jgi:hypothetical protein